MNNKNGATEKSREFKVAAPKRGKKLARKGKTKKAELVQQAWGGTCNRDDGSQMIESDHTDSVAMETNQEEHENQLVSDSKEAQEHVVQNEPHGSEADTLDAGSSSAIPSCSPEVKIVNTPIASANKVTSESVAEVLAGSSDTGLGSQIIPGTFSSPGNPDYNVINPMESPLYSNFKRTPLRKRMVGEEMSKAAASSESYAEVTCGGADDMAQCTLIKEVSEADSIRDSVSGPLPGCASSDVILTIAETYAEQSFVDVSSMGITDATEFSQDRQREQVLPSIGGSPSNVATALDNTEDAEMPEKQNRGVARVLESESTEIQRDDTEAPAVLQKVALVESDRRKDAESSDLDATFDDPTPSISGNSSPDSSHSDRERGKGSVEEMLYSVNEKLQIQKNSVVLEQGDCEISERSLLPMSCAKNEENNSKVAAEERLVTQENTTEASISILDHGPLDSGENFETNHLENAATQETLLGSSRRSSLNTGCTLLGKVDATVQTASDLSGIETAVNSCQTTKSIMDMNICNGCKRKSAHLTIDIYELVKKNINEAVRLKQSCTLDDHERRDSNPGKCPMKAGVPEKITNNGVTSTKREHMGIRIRRYDFVPVWSHAGEGLEDVRGDESFLESPKKRRNVRSQGKRRQARRKNAASRVRSLPRREESERMQVEEPECKGEELTDVLSLDTEDATATEGLSETMVQEAEAMDDVTSNALEETEHCNDSCIEESQDVEANAADDVVPPTPPSKRPLNDTVCSSNKSFLSKVLKKGNKTSLCKEQRDETKPSACAKERTVSDISMSSIILEVSGSDCQETSPVGTKGSQPFSKRNQIFVKSQHEEEPLSSDQSEGRRLRRGCKVPVDLENELSQTEKLTLKRKSRGMKTEVRKEIKKQKIDSDKCSGLQSNSYLETSAHILIGNESPRESSEIKCGNTDVSDKSSVTPVRIEGNQSVTKPRECPFVVTESRVDVLSDNSQIDVLNSQKIDGATKMNHHAEAARDNKKNRSQKGSLSNSNLIQDIPSSILAASNEEDGANELGESYPDFGADVTLVKDLSPEEDRLGDEDASQGCSDEDGAGKVHDAAMAEVEGSEHRDTSHGLVGESQANGKQSASAKQSYCTDDYDDEKDLFASYEEDRADEEDAANEGPSNGSSKETNAAEESCIGEEDDKAGNEDAPDFKRLLSRLSKGDLEEEAEESSEDEHTFAAPPPELDLNGRTIRHAGGASSEKTSFEKTDLMDENHEFESPPSPTPPPKIKRKEISPHFEQAIEVLKELSANTDKLLVKASDSSILNKSKHKEINDAKEMPESIWLSGNDGKEELGSEAKGLPRSSVPLPVSNNDERGKLEMEQCNRHESRRDSTPKRAGASHVKNMADKGLALVPALSIKREVVTTPKLKSESQLRDRSNLGTDAGSAGSGTRAQKAPRVLVPSRLNRKQMVCCKLLADKVGCKFSTSFVDGVSHLIMGTDENFAIDRFAYTYKYLMALMTGSWIVSFKWVTACLNAQKVVDEAQFEVKGDISSSHEMVPKLARISRQRKDSPLFTDLTLSLVGDFQTCNMTKEQLAQLLENGGAEVLFELPTTIPPKNFLLLTDLEDVDSLKCQFIEANIQPVHYQWITESIINYKVQNPAEFLINL